MNPKTYITTRQPWGIIPRNGHRLLCADGVIRAAELAPTPDTFFSHPASVRYKGKRVSGYMTTDTPSGLSSDSPHVHVFRAYRTEGEEQSAPLWWPPRPEIPNKPDGSADYEGWKRLLAEHAAHHAATIAKGL